MSSKAIQVRHSPIPRKHRHDLPSAASTVGGTPLVEFSGAALRAALALAERSVSAGKTIVVIICDTGERYVSSALFSER